MAKFKYKGADLEDIFDTNTGTISGINFSPFPNFNTTNNVNEKYKTNEIKLLGESFKTANQDILTSARNFKVTKASLQNTDGTLNMPAWANAVKIRVTGVKGGIGDTGETGEKGETGNTGDKGDSGQQGDKGATGGKGKNHQYNDHFNRCYQLQTFGGNGGEGGTGGAGGNGGPGGPGGAGGPGGTGGEGGEGGNGGVNIFEDVFTVLNNETKFNFQAGIDGDNTILNATVDGVETLLINLEKGAKGEKGKKGYKGLIGQKGQKGYPGYKGSKGATGGTGYDAGFGNHKYNWGNAKQECNSGSNGHTGSKGANGADNTTTRTDGPTTAPAANTEAGPSPDNNIKGAKGAIRTITTTGTKTSGQTNINGISTTNIQSTPSVELSFFVVDDTEN
jgi:hypothetical protein